MADEYLWDRTGTPDPEVARLEKLLAGYGYAAPKQRSRLPVLLALAAGVALVVPVSLWLRRAPVSEWKITGKSVAVGQTIETGTSDAKLEAEQVGNIVLDRNSRLKIVRSAGGRQELSLQRGTMHALIWAPPSRFVVDTPSARTIDLGCAYTLTVLTDNSGMLTVQTGWVAFQAGATESFIPAGAACRTRVHHGPGLPYFEDASPAFRDAVARFETSSGSDGLEGIERFARRRDALTLWHLIVRTSGPDRDSVVRRFADLVPGVDAEGLREGRSIAIDQAWNQLELGGTDWWRLWKHRWRIS